MDPAEHSQNLPTAEELIHDLDRVQGACCSDCRTQLCNHEALISIMLGFENTGRCLQCLARGLQREPGELLDSLYSYVRQRESYRTAWEWASRKEGVEAEKNPSCMGNHSKGRNLPRALSSQEGRALAQTSSLRPDAEWDAGDMGCGDLVLELRIRLQSMKPGQILKILARDPGAPEDLPAWCRLTGHTLLSAEPPTYWLRRKE